MLVLLFCLLVLLVIVFVLCLFRCSFEFGCFTVLRFSGLILVDGLNGWWFRWRY